MSEEKQNKVWKRAGLYDLYEDASNKKTSLLSEWNDELIVKIKRYGQGYEKFQVKYWHPDFVKPTNNKRKKK
tara:strand:- start:293 stop:508 length:216 start_codon:yes stop_codon:yes gene_type:complete